MKHDEIGERSARVDADTHTCNSRLYILSHSCPCRTCGIVLNEVTRSALAVLLWTVLFASAALAQNFDNIEVQKIAAHLHFAEGPVWSHEGFLLYSDAPVDKFHKFVGGVGDSEAGERAGGAIGNAYDMEGRLYT